MLTTKRPTPKFDQVPVPCSSESEAHDLSDLGVPSVVIDPVRRPTERATFERSGAA